ncbi:MAG: hypothetical protein PHD57_05660 [Desulfobacterales bacterium]|jgi:hypothetical protein|nr:hypothetical protein [Desulfobacterales bacterium]
MLDVSVSYNRYKFIGYEFLTWLWYVIENDKDILSDSESPDALVEIGNRLVLQNHLTHTVETITIKGDDAGLEEAYMALQKGAVVTEINLSYKSEEQIWRFCLKGESLGISNLKTPDTAPIEKKEDIEGAILEKGYLYEKLFSFLDKTFNRFINLRISEAWSMNIVPEIQKWIRSSERK